MWIEDRACQHVEGKQPGNPPNVPVKCSTSMYSCQVFEVLFEMSITGFYLPLFCGFLFHHRKESNNPGKQHLSLIFFQIYHDITVRLQSGTS